MAVYYSFRFPLSLNAMVVSSFHCAVCPMQGMVLQRDGPVGFHSNRVSGYYRPTSYSAKRDSSRSFALLSIGHCHDAAISTAHYNTVSSLTVAIPVRTKTANYFNLSSIRRVTMFAPTWNGKNNNTT